MKYFCRLAILAAFAFCSAQAIKHTVTTSGFTFSPATLTITDGDTVVFVLSGIHDAMEVSQATWNVNGSTPLAGGFSVPFGGGEIVPSGTGTHYYVCENHVLSGMKGRIIVDPAVLPPSSITVSSIVDRDGSIVSTADRMGKNWSMKLYRDSIGSGIVVDSVASGWALLADSLLAGTYVAVEADSAHWTHFSQTVDGAPQGLTPFNFRSVTIGAGEDHTIDFLNYAHNVIISVGFTFEPDTIAIDSSDTVRFVLDTMHTAREVDSLTWVADDTASNGGFDTPFGGGEIIPAQPGTIRYVCVPHASGGMKGIIIVKPQGAFSLPVADGWNLLSMPVVPVDGSVAALYPGATSSAFIYQGGYLAQASVSPGTGYWLKFGGAQSVNLDGGVIAADTVTVSQGWNIVGSISSPVAVSSILSDPGGLVTSTFFGYNLGYFTADTLHPGYGYWVKTGGPGSLILQASPTPAPEAGRIRIVPTSEVPPAGKPDR
ncbi:MAG TPA: plastocyanin/azurin family copper-binding protein [Bacteroidota bacterium]|nr:plastocyanin/azurin family copper-binding protein [Bacteroidota bacterium]